MYSQATSLSAQSMPVKGLRLGDAAAAVRVCVVQLVQVGGQLDKHGQIIGIML